MIARSGHLYYHSTLYVVNNPCVSWPLSGLPFPVGWVRTWGLLPSSQTCRWSACYRRYCEIVLSSLELGSKVAPSCGTGRVWPRMKWQALFECSLSPIEDNVVSYKEFCVCLDVHYEAQSEFTVDAAFLSVESRCFPVFNKHFYSADLIWICRVLSNLVRVTIFLWERSFNLLVLWMSKHLPIPHITTYLCRALRLLFKFSSNFWEQLVTGKVVLWVISVLSSTCIDLKRSV